jgi:hypothetical protein
MYTDLKLTVGNRYSLITLIFFIPYVIFQPPATVILRKMGPRYFLSTIVVLWGATMIVSTTITPRKGDAVLTPASRASVSYQSGPP